MANKEIHHVKLYQSSQIWISFVSVMFVMAGAYWIVFKVLKKEFDEPPSPPFVVDLRNEEFPVTVDYVSRWNVLVRVERPDGAEVRFIDPRDGSLTGTIFEKAPVGVESPSE